MSDLISTSRHPHVVVYADDGAAFATHILLAGTAGPGYLAPASELLREYGRRHWGQKLRAPGPAYVLETDRERRTFASYVFIIWFDGDGGHRFDDTWGKPMTPAMLMTAALHAETRFRWEQQQIFMLERARAAEEQARARSETEERKRELYVPGGRPV